MPDDRRSDAEARWHGQQAYGEMDHLVKDHEIDIQLLQRLAKEFGQIRIEDLVEIDQVAFKRADNMLGPIIDRVCPSRSALRRKHELWPIDFEEFVHHQLGPA